MKKFLMILFVAMMSIMLVVPAFAEGAHDDKIVLNDSTEINLKVMDNFKADTSVDSMLHAYVDAEAGIDGGVLLDWRVVEIEDLRVLGVCIPIDEVEP